MQPADLATPEDAERAFYQAFAEADLEAMMRVWAEDEEVACIHPLREAARGRRAIEESWREIFLAGAPMRFEVASTCRYRDGELAVHCVEESIHHGPRLRQVARILSTNVYRRTAAGWRLVVHHASPTEAAASDEEGRSATLH